MTFTKTPFGPLLLRTQICKIRKHLCLFLSFIPRWFSPTSRAGPQSFGFFGNLSLETAALSGSKAEWHAWPIFPSPCCFHSLSSSLLLQRDRLPHDSFTNLKPQSIAHLKVKLSMAPLNSNCCVIASQLYKQGLQHSVFLGGLHHTAGGGGLLCIISYSWQVARAVLISFPWPQT